MRLKVKTKKPASDAKLAEELCLHYYLALRGLLLGVRRGASIRTSTSYDLLDKSTRNAFKRAARACAAVAGDPREYITAQFQSWAAASQYHNKLLIPQPQHLGSMGAQARYVQYKLRQGESIGRRAPLEKMTKGFFREERKLNGLVRVTRLLPEDVLTERPEEFTREFLEHRGVWGLVETIWHDRNAS